MSMFGKEHDGRIFPELNESGAETPQTADQESAGDDVTARSQDWEDTPIRPSPREKTRERTHYTVVRTKQGGSGGLWLAFTFLLVLLAGAVFFGNQTLEDSNIQLNKVPGMLKSLATVDTRLGDLESQLNAWARNIQVLSGRLNKVDKTARVQYALARKHAEALTAQVKNQVGQLQEQIAERDREVDTRLNDLGDSQKSAQDRIAQLQQQLSDAQQEVASLRQETNGDLATLHQSVAGNNQQLGQLAGEVERHRVDFELSKNKITNLSSEVTINLTATNIPYQQFSGWVYYEPDHRYLWIHQHGVMQPVVFYDAQKSRQYEVVVTQLREDTAVGYLLVPRGSSVVPQQSSGGGAGGK